MIRYNTKRYWGYSTDKKPLDAKYGDTFIEMDTNVEYVFGSYNTWTNLTLPTDTNLIIGNLVISGLSTGLVYSSGGTLVSVTNSLGSNFVGSGAGAGTTIVSSSNFFGQNAGYQATNASNSNFFGYQAGYQATSARYSNFFGYQAGLNADSASYSNLFGYQAGETFTSNNIGANNIIIGTNISLPNATANAINIGGILFGTGTYSTPSGTPSIVPNNGRIGINVINPRVALEVSGGTFLDALSATTISATTYLNLPSTSGLYLPLSGGTVTGQTNIYYNAFGPTSNILSLGLDLNNLLFTFGFANNSAQITYPYNYPANFATAPSYNFDNTVNITTAGSGIYQFLKLGAGSGFDVFKFGYKYGNSQISFITGNTAQFLDASFYNFDNNVGINTITNAGYKLDVNGTTRLNGNTIINGSTTVSSGVYSISAFTGSYIDGIVTDYVLGNGRISVGTGDTLTFYNGGIGVNSLMSISTGGTVSAKSLSATTISATTYYGDGSRLNIRSITAITSSFTATSSNDIIFVSGLTGTTINITLPFAASGNINGNTIKNIGKSTVNILPRGAEAIDGNTSLTILPTSKTALSIIPYGNNWWII